MRASSAGFVVAVSALFVVAPAANAATAPCVAGDPGSPKCLMWEAKIPVVDDGDTVQARIMEGNELAPRRSVRLNGLQAMELHDYSHGPKRSGDCQSLEASNRLQQLVEGKMVRLTAQKASSSTTGEGGRVRLRRTIAVQRGGKWVDVVSLMLAEGHGLWFPNSTEWASNGPYSRIVQEAAARGVGIWNPTNCGVGPSSANPLSLKLKWDAAGVDGANLNGEWVRLKNAGVTPVPLNGWFLRDSHFRGPRKGPIKGRGFKLPANAVIPAGGSIQVHVGRGPNTPTDLFWGLDESVFGNATDDKTQIGDGAYLLDPKGNVRAYTMYPCRAGNCTDPLAGKVKVISRYQGGKQPATGQINEWMTIKNVSVAPISLNEYELESSPWFYEFDQRDVIAPGKAIVVFVDKPYARVPAAPGAGNVTVPALPGRAPFQDVQLGGFRAWNFDLPLLADGGDVVTLRNPGGAPVVCDSWGGDRCPNV